VQPDFLRTILTWASALLLYPGLLFGIALALIAEWIFSLARPLITPGTYRSRATQRTLLQPLYTFLKLSGRRSPARFSPDSTTPTHSTKPSTLLAAASAITPILALALLPFPGSPLNRPGGLQADLLTILLLLAAGPLFKAAWRLLSGDLISLRGAQDLGRLLTGLLPSVLAIAALVEVSDTRSLSVASLTTAPETPGQTIVRLLAGAVLLAALPWWLDWRDAQTSGDNAGIHAGRLLQTSAMSALWSLLILPAPSDRTWAIAITILGALVAYMVMRAIPHLWVPIRRERDAASLVWSTALPVAVLALAIALWTGA
jgi:hypothetical protein